MTRHRTEHDSLGSVPVDADAYYGVHTVRAIENFAVTGTSIGDYPELISALAAVKQGAALANAELGRLDAERAAAIVQACEEIRAGALHDQFPIDPIQGGAGTSSNMNVNEVVANRALEILGCERGDYARLDPLAHVNLGQSTNDVYPTAIRIALVATIRRLDESLSILQTAFENKSREFVDVVKMGRTQLQDAVPMTLGQEFGTYAIMIEEDRDRLREGAALLLESNLGGTAIGTGLNGHPAYAGIACAHLREITGEDVVPARDAVEATQDCGAFVQVSGILKRVAVKLSKMCNDLRLLSSGPSVGLGEINLPAVQAGSSIMPGKVNPVIPELVNQVAFAVIGNDLTVTLAAEGGQLQLNAFEPVIIDSMLRSTRHLAAAVETLARRCVDGITANEDALLAGVERSVGWVTALVPVLGYPAAASLAKESLLTGLPLRNLILERSLIEPARLDHLLSAARLTGRAPATGVIEVAG